MKSNWSFSILVSLFLLSSCINGEQTFQADHSHLLCGGNSKVWMLKGTKQEANAKLHLNSWGEVLFVFYLSGEVLVGSFGDLENKTFDKGHYEYLENKNQLLISIGREKWRFQMQLPSEELLVLETQKGANLAAYLHLVPLTVPR